MFSVCITQWSDTEARERAEIRALLRFKVLQAELENTREDFQLLRSVSQ